VKTIGEFTPDAALDRKLADFQDNVSVALADLESRSASRPTISTQTTGKAAIPVRPGETRFAAGGSEVLLARPRPDDEGRTLNIIQQSAGAVTVRPIGVSVNGAATLNLPAVGRYELLIARGTYWSKP
jgi:hypothetical protein